MQVREFHSFWPELRCSPRQYISRLGSHVGIPLYDVGRTHSSDLYRFAVLVFMSNLKNVGDDRDTFLYLSKFYQQAQKCIDNGSVLEVVYASYLVAVYSLVGGPSVEMAIDSCHQFCRSFVALKSWMVEDDEVLWLETLWQKVLSSLYYVHRDSVLLNEIGEPVRLMHSMEKVERLLSESSSLLPSKEDVSVIQLSMTTEWVCQKVISLAVYMQIYLDQFLFRVTFGAGVEEIRLVQARLSDILERIIQLITYLSNIRDYIHNAYSSRSGSASGFDDVTNSLPKFSHVRPRGLKSGEPKARDTALALLYTFARLLKNMLDPMADFDEKIVTDIHRSAIALCRLCASFPNRSFSNPTVSLLVKRSLFWAGMILTKSRFPEGKNSLNAC